METWTQLKTCTLFNKKILVNIRYCARHHTRHWGSTNKQHTVCILRTHNLEENVMRKAVITILLWSPSMGDGPATQSLVSFVETYDTTHIPRGYVKFYYSQCSGFWGKQSRPLKRVFSGLREQEKRQTQVLTVVEVEASMRVPTHGSGLECHVSLAGAKEKHLGFLTTLSKYGIPRKEERAMLKSYPWSNTKK